MCFYLENSTIAENYSITCLGSVREQWRLLDLYSTDNVLILDGPIADCNGTIIPSQKEKVNEVAIMLENTIKNDIPGFKRKITQIIQFHQATENLSLDMVDILERGLKGDTKMRFMAKMDYRIYARIIRLVFEMGSCSSADELDKQVNDIFNNQNLIMSIIDEIQKG